ncbi:hypothetical protein PIB30_081049 [Stylosanthes scabra]|uniref:Uncharacterized protein n=1 Tax=Stylosanthes scabra TaxID=79078 RepID=A0ABU6RRR1_9FABA|nr:hypothetical protein [Stylosanthes scabra]
MRLEVCWKWFGAAPRRAVGWVCVPPVREITIVIPKMRIVSGGILRFKVDDCPIVRVIIFSAKNLFSSTLFFGILHRIFFLFFNFGILRAARITGVTSVLGRGFAADSDLRAASLGEGRVGGPKAFAFPLAEGEGDALPKTG